MVCDSGFCFWLYTYIQWSESSVKFFCSFCFFLGGFFRGLYIKHTGLRGQFSKVPSRYTQRFAIDNRRRFFGLGLLVSF